ncbi:MAG: PorT family protein [Tannerella sp.]|nr:PorT family protein [Tannerella sp.]
MKKTVLMVLVSVFALQMNAQINEAGRFYITPKIGYNMANISLLDKYGADPRHGINVGISGEYAINEMISIEPGLFYSMQGSTIKVSSVKLGLNSDYLNVPILVKAYVADGLNIFAGPQVGYMMSSRLKVKTGISLIDDILGIVSDNIDLSKYENKLDVSIVVGLGYQLANGFSISASYNVGMTKVPDFGDLKWGDETFTFNPDAKNNVLQVNVGYRF